MISTGGRWGVISSTLLVAAVWPHLALAQTIPQYPAQYVVPGSLTTTGCPTGLPVCFFPFTSSNPLSVTGGGGGAVYGPTAVGSAAANPPVLQGGTANAASNGTVQVRKIDSAGNGYILGGSTTIAHTCAVAAFTMESCLGQIDDDVKGSIPAGSNTIGNVNLTAGANSIGSVGLDPSQTPATTAVVNISTSATTQLVALSSGKATYVTGGIIVAGGTGTIAFEYGTGTLCSTGTTALSGAIPLAANVGFIIPANTIVVPASQALCVVTVGAVQYSGAIGYVQK